MNKTVKQIMLAIVTLNSLNTFSIQADSPKNKNSSYRGYGRAVFGIGLQLYTAAGYDPNYDHLSSGTQQLTSNGGNTIPNVSLDLVLYPNSLIADLFTQYSPGAYLRLIGIEGRASTVLAPKSTTLNAQQCSSAGTYNASDCAAPHGFSQSIWLSNFYQAGLRIPIAIWELPSEQPIHVRTFLNGGMIQSTGHVHDRVANLLALANLPLGAACVNSWYAGFIINGMGLQTNQNSPQSQLGVNLELGVFFVPAFADFGTNGVFTNHNFVFTYISFGVQI